MTFATVFPRTPGSDMNLSAAMTGMYEADVAADGPGFVDRATKRLAVPHGLRSTFRERVAEWTNYPANMAEKIAKEAMGMNPEGYAIRKADMLIKGKDVSKIKFRNT